MKVRIATAQYPIQAHSCVQDWQTYTEKWVASAAEGKAQLAVFPEYGSMELVSLFSPAVQADLKGQIAEMQSLLPVFKATFEQLAKKYLLTILAPSFPVFENQQFVNRAYVFGPKGEVGYQDKLFMTRFENEEWGISAGAKKLKLFQCEWGTFGIQICYDSEFAIGTHLLAQNGMDVLLVPSCTETLRGATRVHIGSRARAMEQQIFSVVAQTVGNAEWSPAVDVNYGYAGFYSSPDKNLPEEGILSQGEAQEIGWYFENLDLNLNKIIREDGQVFNSQDHQQIDMNLVDEKVEVEIHQVDLIFANN